MTKRKPKKTAKHAGGDASSGRFCEDCGAPASPTARFCSSCGRSLAGSTALARRSDEDFRVAGGADRSSAELVHRAMRPSGPTTVDLARVGRPQGMTSLGENNAPLGARVLGGTVGMVDFDSPFHDFGFQRSRDGDGDGEHNPKRAVRSAPGGLCPADAGCDRCDRVRRENPRLENVGGEGDE